jgi:hypothetical protein
MFRYGPYDMLLERIETEVVLQENQRLRSAQERITAAAQYRSNMERAFPVHRRNFVRQSVNTVVKGQL